MVNNTFYLTNDYFVDKLLSQMDVVYNIWTNNNDLRDFIPVIKSCFETLVTMKVNKLKYDAKQSTKSEEEYLQKFYQMFDNFDIYKFVSNNPRHYEEYWLNIIADQITANRDTLLEQYTKNYSNSLIKATTVELVDALVKKDAGKLLFYKNNLGTKKLDVLRELNKEMICSSNGKILTDALIIDNYLSVISDSNKKIDFKGFSKSEKYEFMSIVMFNAYFNSWKETFKPCMHFYLNDIEEYLNNHDGLDLNFIDEDAMKYILPIVPNLNERIRNDEDFKDLYLVVKDSDFEAGQTL